MPFFSYCQDDDTRDSMHRTTYHEISDSAQHLITQGDTGSAMEYHNKAIAYARQHNLYEHQAESLIKVALLLKNKNSDESLLHLNNALEIAKRVDSPELSAEIMKAIGSVYKDKQNYIEALAALESHEILLRAAFEKTRKQEAERLHAEEEKRRERTIFYTIVFGFVLLGGSMAFYNWRIRRLNRKLRKTNKIKDSLLLIIGHDLRGPSASIMQGLEAIRDKILSPEDEKDVLSLLLQESHSFNETMNTLLNWSSAQLKGLNPTAQSVSVNEAIQRVLELSEVQAKMKNVHIGFTQNEEVVALVDRDQLDFIIRNLLSNAIKFSLSGGQIDIAVHRRDKDVVLTIRDQGAGIAADKQKAVFSEANLGSSRGTKGEHGNGMGLILSREFAKANRGRIWFESKEGVGTTFFLRLPRAEA